MYSGCIKRNIVLKTIIFNFQCYSFMSKDYVVENSINVTDWMANPDLLPIGNNFDKLFKGFLETPGRISQPSYNFFVILKTKNIFII